MVVVPALAWCFGRSSSSQHRTFCSCVGRVHRSCYCRLLSTWILSNLLARIRSLTRQSLESTTSVRINEYYTTCVCIYSLMYAARNAHSPYFHLWPVNVYSIFPHFLINGTIFERKKLINTMCVLVFSTSETFFILRNEQDIKNV